MAESVIKLPTGSSEQASLRQPPTVSDTTAAAFLRSTIAWSSEKFLPFSFNHSWNDEIQLPR